MLRMESLPRVAPMHSSGHLALSDLAALTKKHKPGWTHTRSVTLWRRHLFLATLKRERPPPKTVHGTNLVTQTTAWEGDLEHSGDGGDPECNRDQPVSFCRPSWLRSYRCAHQTPNGLFPSDGLRRFCIVPICGISGINRRHHTPMRRRRWPSNSFRRVQRVPGSMARFFATPMATRLRFQRRH